MKKNVLAIISFAILISLNGCASKKQLTIKDRYGYKKEEINNLSKNIQLSLMEKNADLIQYIENPSEEVQLAAVQKSGNVIQFIKNPSEKVQFSAVDETCSAIHYIKNPSEEVQLEAFSSSVCGTWIEYITNPSEKVQIAAVNSWYNAIKGIKNPSLLIKIYAVEHDGDAIEYIKIKPKFLQALAVKTMKEGFLCTYVKDRLDKLSQEYGKLTANLMSKIEGYPYEKSEEVENFFKILLDVKNIESINNPTQDMIVLAALLDPQYISKINNQSEKLLSVFIKLDTNNIKYIHNPSKNLIALAEKYTIIQRQNFLEKEKRDIALLKRRGAREIGHIQNPSEKVQLYAMSLNNGGAYYSDIKSDNISNNVKLAALKSYVHAIRDIKNPTEEMQMIVAKSGSYEFRNIKNPSEKVQLAAIKENPKAIQYIKNPTLRVLLLVNKELKLTLKHPSFKASSKFLSLNVNGNKLKVSNSSKKFIKIKSIAEYFGENVNSLKEFNIPPETIITRTLSSNRKTTITSANQKIQYGFAIEYKLPNDNKIYDFYKTKKYKVSGLLQ